MGKGRAFVLGLVLLTLAAPPAIAAEAKRVLVVHSFGSTAPPFTTHSTAFETALTQAMGKRVDLDEVSLDMARYSQPDMEEPFAELMRKRLAKWQPDLVVPVGSPAGRFVTKYRQRLFPKTPVIYTGMDRRTLPPGAFQNSTFVGEDFNLTGLVEDILQLAPDTNQIVVVLGASPLERFWTAEFQRAFAPFMDRVAFTWVNDLTFDQMLELAATLPPRSFILLGLLIRDAAGVTHNEDEALLRLHAVTKAPINGLYQHQLGLGIVGGRLYQAEAQGVEAARIAVRILRGEPVESFPPLIIPAQGPRYDWRELQRWSIPENRVPPGSVIQFREPTAWERYRWWLLGTLVFALLQTGLIVLLAVTLSKRRRAERALRESERRVTLAAESSGAGLWSLDLATRRVWATPRLRELFQLGPEDDLTDEHVFAAIHPEDRERVRRAFVGIPTASPAGGLEFRIMRTDGTERWVGTWGLHDNDGKRRGARWSGASADITERKLGEQRLLESESRFRAVADSAPVLIWMSGLDRRATFFNKPWLDFTGRKLEEEQGSGWAEGVHPEDRPGCLQTGTAAFGARRPFTMEYRLRRYDGEYRWVSSYGVPRYDAQGEFVGYIGSCVDITERLRAETEAQELRQELAHISRISTIGELTAAIVHELSQPLTAIRTNAEAGRRLIASGKQSDHELREILEDIVGADARAGQVIQHMRTLFRKGMPERRPLLLNNLINDVISLVGNDARLKNVAIELDLATRLRLVLGDRVQLQQVMLNLVVNAFDAMAAVADRPRRLIVRTRALEPGAVQLEVVDTGVGIAADALKTIFDPFVTTKVGGMGMGLSVSRTIVRAHAGEIWAENGPEGGAVFRVVLPAISVASETTSAPTP